MSWMVVMPPRMHSTAPNSVRARISAGLRGG
jgi:hypothetical protein